MGRVEMRWLIVIAGLCVAVFGATPALAHAHAKKAAPETHRTVPPPAPLKARPASPCEVRTAVVREAAPPVETHVHSHDHDGGEHNPADHSHPVGADVLHQIMFHHSVDAAFQVEFALPARTSATAETIDHRDERRTGITVLPPVPPPLG